MFSLNSALEFNRDSVGRVRVYRDVIQRAHDPEWRRYHHMIVVNLHSDTGTRGVVVTTLGDSLRLRHF